MRIKKITALLLAAALAVSIAGCSNNEESSSSAVNTVPESSGSQTDNCMFNSGLAPLYDRTAELWGYVNAKGEWVIKPQYEEAGKFSDGLACTAKKGEYIKGYIDPKGEWVIEPKFRFANDFSDGLALVQIEKEGNEAYYGYIDTSGGWAVEPEFNSDLYYCNDFHDGLAAVNKYEEPGSFYGLYGYIDKTGKWAVEPQYDSAVDFSDGLAKVEKKVQYGYIDNTGKPVIDCKFEEAFDFHDGRAVVISDGKKGLIDKSGNYAAGPFENNYDGMGIFSDGLISAAKDGIYGYLDGNGNTVIAHQYNSAGDFHNGKAVVCKDTKIETENQENDESSTDLAEYKHTYLIIDKSGNTAAELGTFSADTKIENFFDDGYAYVREDYKTVNIIDAEGNLLIK